MTVRRAVAVLLLVLAACSTGDEGRADGVVIDLVGGISSIESFTVRLGDGTDRIFEPAPGILFHGAAPLAHLRDHLVSGERVEVRFRTLDDGTLLALDVGDA